MLTASPDIAISDPACGKEEEEEKMGEEENEEWHGGSGCENTIEQEGWIGWGREEEEENEETN